MASRYTSDVYIISQNHELHEECEIVVTDKDKVILRELGKKIAEIGSLPIQQQRKAMWSRMNSLQETKPMVWMCDICWNEMEVDQELTLQTSSTFCQRIETELRAILYRWKHMPCDMVVEPIVYAPLVFSNSGFGITVQENILTTDKDNEVVSHQFHIQIRTEEDIEKIQMPRIAYHAKPSAENYQAYREIFDGILSVEKRGATGFWFSLWDEIITWTGVQEGLVDLALRPDYIHKLVDRLITASLHALDQYEELNLLALNSANIRIGSGAYGYTDELPQPDYTPDHVRTKDLWGCAADQILGDVSPKMHEEFALQYDRRWLERFGLTHYGCCEPLHKKIDMLRSIPNLRRISMSPWADLEKAAEQVHGDYVLSIKPSPAILARDVWHPDLAREELEAKLKIAKAHHCQAELIMKDISTVRYEPQRLWEWAKIASEVAQKYA
jgi:hypothetical protein